MRKAINFDLNTICLKEYYDKGDYHNAYKDIERFLTKRGFEHRQGSSYISTTDISNYKVERIIRDLSITFKWFSKSVSERDLTSVGKSIPY